MEKRERKDNRIKIIELSSKDCKPCKELQDEIESLSSKYDIDLMVVDIGDFNDGDLVTTFGKVEVIPTTIIEAGGKAKKIIGYKQGEIIEAVEEILKPEEE